MVLSPKPQPTSSTRSPGAEDAARQQLVAVSGEPGHEQVLEALELVEQHRVPGFDDDVVLVHARSRILPGQVIA